MPYAENATKHFPAHRPVLPEWTRFAWTSDDERGWWKPHVEAIVAMLGALERETVVHGLRDAGILDCAPQDLPHLTEWARANGLVVFPQRIVAGSVLSSAAPPRPGDRWTYRVLVVRPERVPLTDVHLRTNAGLGPFLGFPPCCRAFFEQTWGAGQVDTTWDQYAAAGTADGPRDTNLLWRWLGARWVFHLPCSHLCDATVRLGQQHRALALELGYAEEVTALNEILSWPVHWSAVNGIAQIVGPCVRVSTRTDWSPEARQFRRHGEYHAPEPWLWRDNGFASPEGMRAAHDPIVRAVVEHAPAAARICDLGCGNGLLLRRVKMRRPDVSIAGVDLDETATAHARQHLVGQWTVANLRADPWPGNPTVVLLSVNRLTPAEMSQADAAQVREALKKTDRVFVYAYGDNLAAAGSLHALCAQAGLPRHPAMIAVAPDVAVGLFEGAEL